MVNKELFLGTKFRGTVLKFIKIKSKLLKNYLRQFWLEGVRSFLGHAGFYRQFIQDFSKIAIPLCSLFAKEITFVFDNTCLDSFKMLKEKKSSQNHSS